MSDDRFTTSDKVWLVAMFLLFAVLTAALRREVTDLRERVERIESQQQEANQ